MEKTTIIVVVFAAALLVLFGCARNGPGSLPAPNPDDNTPPPPPDGSPVWAANGSQMANQPAAGGSVPLGTDNSHGGEAPPPPPA